MAHSIVVHDLPGSLRWRAKREPSRSYQPYRLHPVLEPGCRLSDRLKTGSVPANMPLAVAYCHRLFVSGRIPQFGIFERVSLVRGRDEVESLP